MPSGSDAEYIPLLIAKLRNQGKQILNVVTCNEEVGSGTLDAAGGKFFSHIEPISYGCGAKAGDPVEGLATGVSNCAIPARHISGQVVEQNEEIHKALFQCEQNGLVPLVHTVYGSKTGICQEFDNSIVDRVDSMRGVLVADLCQGRFEKQRLTSYLKKNVVVLITGSKFFRGPPFSGGVLVSKTIMKELQEMGNNVEISAGLNSFIGKNEIPRELPSWRDQMGDNQNPALALRWVAALAEMEPTLAIP